MCSLGENSRTLAIFLPTPLSQAHSYKNEPCADVQVRTQGPEPSSLPSTLVKTLAWGQHCPTTTHSHGAQRPGAWALGGSQWTMDGHGHALSR